MANPIDFESLASLPIGAMLSIFDSLTIEEIMNLEREEILRLERLQRQNPTIFQGELGARPLSQAEIRAKLRDQSSILRITRGDHSNFFLTGRILKHISNILKFKPNGMAIIDFYLNVNSLVKKYVKKGRSNSSEYQYEPNLDSLTEDELNHLSFDGLPEFLFEQDLPDYLIKSFLTWAYYIQGTSDFNSDSYYNQRVYYDLYKRGDPKLIWWFYEEFGESPHEFTEYIDDIEDDPFSKLKPILDILVSNQDNMPIIRLLVYFSTKFDPDYQAYVKEYIEQIDENTLSHGRLELLQQLKNLVDNDFQE